MTSRRDKFLATRKAGRFGRAAITQIKIAKRSGLTDIVTRTAEDMAIYYARLAMRFAIERARLDQ